MLKLLVLKVGRVAIITRGRYAGKKVRKHSKFELTIPQPPFSRLSSVHALWDSIVPFVEIATDRLPTGRNNSTSG